MIAAATASLLSGGGLTAYSHSVHPMGPVNQIITGIAQLIASGSMNAKDASAFATLDTFEHWPRS